MLHRKIQIICRVTDLMPHSGSRNERLSRHFVYAKSIGIDLISFSTEFKTLYNEHSMYTMLSQRENRQ